MSRPQPPELARIITRNRRLLEVLALLARYAATDLPVLIRGEAGTGKELAAEAVWALSARRHRSYHRLNCAVLTPELATSELFGHQRGAFTGAEQSHPGKFGQAQGGTLFLDEVGDLPLSVQPRLLRAVEQGEIEPVGGVGRRVDVRLIAATNQNLTQLKAQGRFRQDLYDRLAVLEIELPPLRERGQDVLLLARHFLEAAARHYGRPVTGLSAAAMARLQAYSWPGNVRELRNVITRAVLFGNGPLVEAKDLMFPPAAESAATGWNRPDAPRCAGTACRLPAGAVEVLPLRPTRAELEELLRESGGNVAALARRLQVCTRTVYRWFKTYGLAPREIRGAAASARAGRPALGDALAAGG